MKANSYIPKGKDRGDRNSVWQTSSPIRNKCCLCGKRNKPGLSYYPRPTGAHRQLQDWPVCQDCNPSYLEWARPLDPEYWSVLLRICGIDPHCTLKVPSFKVR